MPSLVVLDIDYRMTRHEAAAEDTGKDDLIGGESRCGVRVLVIAWCWYRMCCAGDG